MVLRQFKLLSLVLILLGIISAEAMPAGSRITLPSGKKIFVSGMNLAWINYAGDVGPTPLDTAKVNKAMKAIADSGANAMRIWLSTDGTNDPIYTNGLVSGPASQTIPNIKKMLSLAGKNKIMLILCLLTHNWVNKSINATILANNKTMLTTENGLQAYIDNYLKKVVTEIGNDPNILCWEVFNEPEGMVDGWSSPKNTITQAQVQKAVNRIAAEIHTDVPGVLVSNGTATIGTLSWYTDAALTAAGGKNDGTLDFYMAHYYGWCGTSNSPFTKSYANWNLDKPLVIGEYPSSSWSPSTASSSPTLDAANVDTLMRYLDKAGYAGGLGWQYQPDAGDTWLKGFSTFGHSMAVEFRADSNDIKLDGTSSNSFSVSYSAGEGGTVKSSITGRVDYGKSDTLAATPNEGYTFTGWTGDTTCSSPILVIKSVTKGWSVHANFNPGEGVNMIKAGDFSDGTKWGFYPGNDKGDSATITFTNEQANVTVAKIDSTSYHIQLSQSGLNLNSGVTYVVQFDAWSTASRPFSVALSNETTWHYQGGGDVTLTATKATYKVEITPDSTTSGGILQFNFGASLLPVYIDNVSLVKKSGTSVMLSHKVFKSSPVFFNRIGDRIFWTASSKNAGVSLIDLNGRIIMPATMNNPVHLTNVPSGIYLFVVKDGIKSSAFKIAR